MFCFDRKFSLPPPTRAQLPGEVFCVADVSTLLLKEHASMWTNVVHSRCITVSCETVTCPGGQGIVR